MCAADGRLPRASEGKPHARICEGESRKAELLDRTIWVKIIAEEKTHVSRIMNAKASIEEYKGVNEMPHQLPDLPYAYDALTPFLP